MTDGAFLTGGTGFVGGALLRLLTSGARPVAALARHRTNGEVVAAAGARPVIGTLADVDVLADGMAGCSTVFHVAGVNAMCLRDPAEMFATNVAGTRAVVRTAARAGVRRVVLTSSAATIGEAAGTVGTETSPHRGSYLSNYERSKREGELAAFEEAAAAGVELVVVNPSSVQGPGRTRGSARLLLTVLKSRFPVVIDTHVSVVDVEDCAMAHLLADRNGVPGERYIVNGASLTVAQMVDLIAEVTGRRCRPITLPRLVVGGLGDAAARLAERSDEPILCREMLRTLRHGHRFDGSKAARDLGLEYTPLRDTLARTIRWYVDFSFVPPLPNFPVLRR